MYAQKGFLCGAAWVAQGQRVPDGIPEDRMKLLAQQGVVGDKKPAPGSADSPPAGPETADKKPAPESADSPPAGPETADNPPPRPRGLSTKTASGVVEKK